MKWSLVLGRWSLANHRTTSVMTLEDIENAFPNGLHDAEMQRHIVDYGQRTLTAEVAGAAAIRRS